MSPRPNFFRDGPDSNGPDLTAGGSGGGGGGAIVTLPAAGQNQKLQVVQAALGRPWPFAYGRHVVGGAPIFQEEDAAKTRAAFFGLGVGEWDSIEALLIDGSSKTIPTNSLFHFHPGLDGELGTETDPAVRNQKICSFLPAAFAPRLTFSRLAYLSMSLPPNAAAPGPDILLWGVYKTRRVSVFDSAGAITSYAYSANPAWCIVDALLTFDVKPHRKINEALTTAEKAKFEWQSFIDAATYFAADPGTGAARFESHVAIFDTSDVKRLIELLLLTCRGYLIERNGKYVLYPDKARSSVFTVTRDALRGPATFSPRTMDQQFNHLVLKARILDSGGGTVTKDFQDARKEFTDEDNQDQTGAIRRLELDIQNTTLPRMATIGRGLRKRLMQLPKQASFPLGAEVAGAASNPLEIEPGDRIAGPKDGDTEAWETRDWEVSESSDEPDFSRQAKVREYDETIFADALDVQTVTAAASPGTGLVPSAGAGALSYRPVKNILRASDAGATATIFVEDPDTNDDFEVTFSGFGDIVYQNGSLTLLSFDALYHVYTKENANPPAGGAVSFFTAATRDEALNGQGHIYLGSIRTPKDGEADTTGNNDGGTGAQYGGHVVRRATIESISGTPTSAGNGKDGDWSTFARGARSGNISGSASVILSGFGVVGVDDGRIYKNIVVRFKSAGAATTEGSSTTGAVITSKINGTTKRTATATAGGGSASLSAAVDTHIVPDGTLLSSISCVIQVDSGGSEGADDDGTKQADGYEAVLEADF